jgi:hypothetical protein
MIDKQTLKTALLAAGCTKAEYEAAALANITADVITPADTMGLVIEPQGLTLDVQGNGVHENYQLTVEIFRQCAPETAADDNDPALRELLTLAKTFIHNLIRSGAYQKLPSVPVTKITERRYDANVVGWSLLLNLRPLDNGLNC